MNGRIDAERILDAFLAPEGDRLHDRVIDATLADIARTPQRRTPRVPWRFPKMSNLASSARTVLVGAVLLLAVVGATILIASNQPDLPTASPPASTADAIPPTASASPSQVPTPPSVVVARGWPSTGGNGPGLYAWDGIRCAGTFCGQGFIHDKGVAITIEEQTEQPVVAGATAVSIAGLSGLYRRVVDAEPPRLIKAMTHLEEWIVEIDGVWVTIRLWSDPRASDANLADAHAIIDSMRYEPTARSVRGFWITFRLTNSEWDSG